MICEQCGALIREPKNTPLCWLCQSWADEEMETVGDRPEWSSDGWEGDGVT